MNYHDHLNIRKHPDQGFIYPDCCPHLKMGLNEFGHLIHRSEDITLRGYIDRITDRSPHPLRYQVADILDRWLTLMNATTESLLTKGTLLQEFQWEGEVYSFDECLQMLGKKGIKHAITTVREIEIAKTIAIEECEAA